MENFLPFIWMWPRVFCQFQEYCGGGVVKGETDVSTFPGTYSELPGWPGSFHSCSAQSLLPGTSCVKAPFEIDQGQRSIWALRKWKGRWTSHLVKPSCVLWWLFPDYPCLGAAILCGESILGGHHLDSPPTPLPLASILVHWIICTGLYTQRAFSGSQLSGFLNWNALSLFTASPARHTASVSPSPAGRSPLKVQALV